MSRNFTNGFAIWPDTVQLNSGRAVHGPNLSMRVSIIIPVFNSATTVSAAIESALCQNFSGEREVIAVNDGSTDSSAAVLSSFYDRIKTVTQANRGLSGARNAGAAAAAPSEYLAFLDADDVWLPAK